MTTEETAGVREIRRRRGWIWFWLLSSIPALLIARGAIHSNAADVIVVVVIWASGFVISIARGMFSRCPRCGALFFSTHGSPTMWNLLAGQCMQCGLPLKAERTISPNLSKVQLE